MLILARLLGVLIIGMGTVIAFNPKMLTSVMDFWKKGKRIYLAGSLRLLFGLVFLVIAGQCRLPPVMSILGALMILGGILVFALGPQKIEPMFNWWQSRPPLVKRLAGLAAITIGALVLYSV